MTIDPSGATELELLDEKLAREAVLLDDELEIDAALLLELETAELVDTLAGVDDVLDVTDEALTLLITEDFEELTGADEILLVVDEILLLTMLDTELLEDTAEVLDVTVLTLEFELRSDELTLLVALSDEALLETELVTEELEEETTLLEDDELTGGVGCESLYSK